ncbi:hypothetical protein F1559_004930 [Cyanidiococcus yangmingshanensis]|uniref:Uncharacterized protein n=1 Tax=Cyanidiococcus yangmingshanensis TaxID=2690220 RepID=A0A7J7IQM1_9RHOD|nr:hypothetical protein F1559_004930 [Cyanidiococcus yangmingshanensis]
MDSNQRHLGRFQRAVRRSDEIAREPLFPRCPIGWENYVPSGKLRVPCRSSPYEKSLSFAGNSSEPERNASTSAPTGPVKQQQATETGVANPNSEQDDPSTFCVDSTGLTDLQDLDESGSHGLENPAHKRKNSEIYLVEWSRALAIEEMSHWGLVDIVPEARGSQHPVTNRAKHPFEEQRVSPAAGLRSDRTKLSWVTASVLERFGNEAFAHFRKQQQQQAFGTDDPLEPNRSALQRPKRNTRYSRHD